MEKQVTGMDDVFAMWRQLTAVMVMVAQASGEREKAIEMLRAGIDQFPDMEEATADQLTSWANLTVREFFESVFACINLAEVNG